MSWKHHRTDSYSINYPDGWQGSVQRTQLEWTATISKGQDVKTSAGHLLTTVTEAQEWCNSQFRAEQVAKYVNWSPKKRLFLCRVCHTSVKVRERLHHLMTYHPAIIAYERPRPTTEHKQPSIILQSKRGRRVTGSELCQMCHTLRAVWRYTKSSQGTVYLCQRCKDAVYDFSFGRVDLVDVAVSSGFETSKRRH